MTGTAIVVLSAVAATVLTQTCGIEFTVIALILLSMDLPPKRQQP